MPLRLSEEYVAHQTRKPMCLLIKQFISGALTDWKPKQGIPNGYDETERAYSGTFTSKTLSSITCMPPPDDDGKITSFYEGDWYD
ncbi:MAG: hypothetical protein IPF46_16090 [Saprospiraceae bacterium]|nr:hypothetical protein [Candidatus Vicinibacter affinis]